MGYPYDPSPISGSCRKEAVQDASSDLLSSEEMVFKIYEQKATEPEALLEPVFATQNLLTKTDADLGS